MDKIEELKKLLWILDSKHNVSIPQTKENIDYIADEIVKLFCKPAVMVRFFEGWIIPEKCPECGKRKRRKGWKVCPDCMGDLDII